MAKRSKASVRQFYFCVRSLGSNPRFREVLRTLKKEEYETQYCSVGQCSEYAANLEQKHDLVGNLRVFL